MKKLLVAWIALLFIVCITANFLVRVSKERKQKRKAFNVSAPMSGVKTIPEESKPTRDPFVEPEVLKNYRKENEDLKAENEELKKQIEGLQNQQPQPPVKEEIIEKKPSEVETGSDTKRIIKHYPSRLSHLRKTTKKDRQ